MKERKEINSHLLSFATQKGDKISIKISSSQLNSPTAEQTHPFLPLSSLFFREMICHNFFSLGE